MHQAFTRAYVKLSFAFGLGHLIANTTGVVRFDHIQEKLGQIWNMVELTRSAIVAAEAGAQLDEGGVWYPDDRPVPRAARRDAASGCRGRTSYLQLIGGGGFMCTPSEADMRRPAAPTTIAKYYQAAGADAERRIRLFRLAWDYVGSDLGGRGELYERFYLSDSFRMTALAYKIADKTRPVEPRRAVPDRTTDDADRLLAAPLPRGALLARAARRPGTTWATSLVLEYWAEPDAVRAVLPPGLEPHPDDPVAPRRCSSTGSRARSTATSSSTRRAASTRSSSSSSTRCCDGEQVTTCPYIWVDRDFALVRGWIQGFPKKLGLDLDDALLRASRATPPRPSSPGGTFAGTLAANDRRLAEGRVTLEREAQGGPTHNDPPLVNRPPLPAARRRPARRRPRWTSSCARGAATARSPRSGRGRRRSTLQGAPNEEHVALAPVRMGRGFRFTFAYTVDDLETVRDLSNGGS